MKMSGESKASALDVAEFILEKHGPTTAMKLQKLVYYCQAWSLVWDERALFYEKIEAWRNGPVVRSLYDAHRGKFMVESIPGGNPAILDAKAVDTINSVLKYYGDKSPQYLSDLTHMEDPWKKARIGCHADDERSNNEITLDSIEEYYSSLPPE